MKTRSLQIVVIGGIALLLLAAFSVFRQVQEYRNEWLQASAREVAATAQEISHRLQERRRKVETLRLIVTEVLAKDSDQYSLSRELVQDELGYYQAKPPVGSAEAHVGRVTGLGVPALADPSFVQELDAVWQLVPLFRLSHQQDPGIPWIYYLSNRDFLLLYPWASLDQYRYEPGIKQLEFWRAVVPEQNPEKKLRWTAVYDDGAGKGLMITASAPIYVNGQFRGIVAIDFLLAEFNALLGNADYEGATLLLFDNADQLAASYGAAAGSLLTKRETVLPAAVLAAASDSTLHFQQIDDWHVLRYAIDDGATTLYALQSSQRVWWLAARQALAFALLVVLGSLLLVLLIRSEHAAHHIEQLTITDGLTGAFNRRHFDAVYIVERERAQRAGGWFAVLMVDVDYFKRYNDHYGHLAGDEALRKVAHAMTLAIRRGGDMLFRWGGEEFIILMSVDSPDRGREIAERVRLAVSELNIEHLDSSHRRLTVSMGLALSAVPADAGRDAMIRCADQALYEAKAGGRNTLCVAELAASAVRAA